MSKNVFFFITFQQRCILIEILLHKIILQQNFAQLRPVLYYYFLYIFVLSHYTIINFNYKSVTVNYGLLISPGK